MDAETSIAVLRLGLIALLYLFLLQGVLLIWRDISRSSRPARAASHVPGGRLVVLECGETGLGVGQHLALEAVTSLGRDPSNTIVLDDGSVSAKHAVLYSRRGRWWVEDLKSTNGTLVNDELVLQPTPVGTDDVIQLGRIKLLAKL
ncbi:MAG: FHA domain-containing protein [Chloroflexi bacterium]|nr:FHA domain-containing protein [Chloroflexota bacterium]